MAKTTIAFQVIPKVEDSRLYSVVDEAIKVAAQSGLRYEVGPMETTLEGEPDEVWEIIKKAMDACLAAGASRVITNVKIDYVPQGSTIDEKIAKYRRKQ